MDDAMHAHHDTALKHQFDDLDQQYEADTLGMWTFLATELLLFGGVFAGYAVYRALYPEAWAEGSHHNNLLLGTLNTGVLLVSSLTMALAVHASEEEKWKPAVRFLGLTLLLGLTFLGIKFYEYYEHHLHHLVPFLSPDVAAPPRVQLFFNFYFAMTGLHALHMIIGIGAVGTVTVLARRGRLRHAKPVEITGLYWHLIDVIWIFLFPLLYLIDR